MPKKSAAIPKAMPVASPDTFRRLALALPGAVESSHMGAPDFRINGRIFATLASQAKGYGNLGELAHLMELVADGLGLQVGRLDFVVKSAHIYEPDFSLMRNALTAHAA